MPQTQNAPAARAEGACCQFPADSSVHTTTIVRAQYLARHGVPFQRADLIGAELSLVGCPIIARHLGNPALLQKGGGL